MTVRDPDSTRRAVPRHRGHGRPKRRMLDLRAQHGHQIKIWGLGSWPRRVLCFRESA